MKKLLCLLLLIAVSSLPLFASSEDLNKGGVASVNATQSLIDLNGEHLIIVNDGNSKIYFQINGGGVLTTVTTADMFIAGNEAIVFDSVPPDEFRYLNVKCNTAETSTLRYFSW
jgi:hypothetical protein